VLWPVVSGRGRNNGPYHDHPSSYTPRQAIHDAQAQGPRHALGGAPASEEEGEVQGQAGQVAASKEMTDQTIDVKSLYERWASGERDVSKLGLSTVELEAAFQAEEKGGPYTGELPIQDQIRRERALDSPSYLATEIVDPYYKRYFVDPVHYQCMDDVIAPYLCGETVALNGQSYDPRDYLGLIILFSRKTFKSSMAWLMLLWCFVHWKIRLKRDARAMYVHQVIKKAIQRGENIRHVAKANKRFRNAFPEFAAPQGEWDTKDAWSWTNFAAKAAGEPSFTAYGETSDKTGGHYSPRIVDDWETESIKSVTAREDNYQTFLGMDPLIDDTEEFCPYLIMGTTYFWDGTHERLLRDGGYLVWKLPAFEGSPKALFDLLSLDPRVPAQKKRIDRGIRVLERERQADLNFPGLLTWEKCYRRARGCGPRIFSGQYLLNPTPEGEQRFDHQAIDDSWKDAYWPPSECWAYIRCDPAISKKKEADETAIGVGLIHWTGKRMLVDGWVGRENLPNEIVRKCYTFAQKWQELGYHVRSIGIERVAYQAALVNLAKKGVPEREATYDGESIRMMTKPCPVVGIDRGTDATKQERLLSMDGPITRRELLLYKKCPIAHRAVTQLKQYPMGPDDILDMLHDLWIRTQTPSREIEPEPPAFPDWVMRELYEHEPPVMVGTHGKARLINWG
jgi:hypothetical protein